jgi:hypothetical protein
MSETGSSMSEPATSTVKMPVMSPGPSAPGPARSQSDAIRLAVEGGIGAQARRLAGGERHLAVRLGEAGQRIDEQEDMGALVAEGLGDGHGGPGGAALDQRRLVGGRRDHHRTGHALRPEHVLDEMPHLAPALADQAEHDGVGLDAAGEVGEERRLADARAREDADALAAGEGKDGVEDRQAGC